MDPGAIYDWVINGKTYFYFVCTTLRMNSSSGWMIQAAIFTISSIFYIETVMRIAAVKYISPPAFLGIVVPVLCCPATCLPWHSCPCSLLPRRLRSLAIGDVNS